MEENDVRIYTIFLCSCRVISVIFACSTYHATDLSCYLYASMISMIAAVMFPNLSQVKKLYWLLQALAIILQVYGIKHNLDSASFKTGVLGLCFDAYYITFAIKYINFKTKKKIRD